MFVPPYLWWPEEGSLLMWGQLAETQDLYWLTDGDPDRWPVIATRGRELVHARLEMTATELILALLTGRPELPDFLPTLAHRSHHEFEQPWVPS